MIGYGTNLSGLEEVQPHGKNGTDVVAMSVAKFLV